jgi:hypothetical protein
LVVRNRPKLTRVSPFDKRNRPANNACANERAAEDRLVHEGTPRRTAQHREEGNETAVHSSATILMLPRIVFLYSKMIMRELAFGHADNAIGGSWTYAFVMLEMAGVSDRAAETLGRDDCCHAFYHLSALPAANEWSNLLLDSSSESVALAYGN